jgi:hypothetical protein
MEQIDPQEAAAELKTTKTDHEPVRRRTHTRKPVEAIPPTAAELGLGISSLVVGVLLALATIPAALVGGLLHNAIFVAVAVIPFAIAAAVCGFIGRRSATGVAGLVLSILACVEAAGVLGWIQYEKHAARFHALDEQRLALEEQNARTRSRNAEAESMESLRQAAMAKQNEAKLLADAARAQKEIEASKIAADNLLKRDQLALQREREQAERDKDRERQRKIDEIEFAKAEEERKKQAAKDAMENAEYQARIDAAQLKIAEETRASQLAASREFAKRRADAEAKVKALETNIRVGENLMKGAQERQKKLASQDSSAENYNALREKAQADYQEGLNRRNKAQNELHQAQRELEELRQAERAAPSIEIPAPGIELPAAVPVGANVTVYKLKDGKTINAVTVITSNDDLVIKDDKGKFHNIKKSDVTETIKP